MVLATRQYRLNGRIACMVVCMIAAIGGVSSGEESVDPVFLAAQEQALVEESALFSTIGGQAMAQGEFADARQAYAQAWQSLPEKEQFVVQREQAILAWIEASIAYARALATTGQAGLAEEVIAEVSLQPLAAVDEEMAAVLLLIEERKQPAETAETRANVQEVIRLLHLAESQLRTAQYDLADSSYYQVLQIDPYNSTARNGLSLVAEARSQFNEVEYAQARAEMLAEVSRQWELPNPEIDYESLQEASSWGLVTSGSMAIISEKLSAVEIEQISLQDQPLREVLDILRYETEKAGVAQNFIYFSQIEEEEQERAISLELANVSLLDLLDIIADLSNTSWGIELDAITFRPDSGGGRMYPNVYNVPRSVFMSLATPSEATSQAGNPFAREEAVTAPVRLGARQVLESLGIEFREGTAVNYNQSSQLLSFTGDTSQHELLNSLLDNARLKSERLVQIEVRILKIGNLTTEELSFDHLLGQANIPGNSRMFFGGGTAGNQDQGAVSRQYPFVYPQSAGLPLGIYPLTGGLRSGDEVLSQRADPTSITAARVALEGRQLEAPGIFSLAGIMTDPQWQTVLRGLSQNSGTDFVATPSAVTLNGQQVTFSQGNELIYPGDFDPPELPSGVAGGSSLAVTPSSPRDWKTKVDGISLQVLPTITADGNAIVLDLNPVMNVFEGFVNYGAPITQVVTDFFGNPRRSTVTTNAILQPIFRKFEAQTQLTVYPGETLVFGGIVQDDRIHFVDKVPFLGDLPLLGRLFQSRGEEIQREAIIFSVTAQILDPAGREL